MGWSNQTKAKTDLNVKPNSPYYGVDPKISLHFNHFNQNLKWRTRVESNHRPSAPESFDLSQPNTSELQRIHFEAAKNLVQNSANLAEKIRFITNLIVTACFANAPQASESASDSMGDSSQETSRRDPMDPP